MSSSRGAAARYEWLLVRREASWWLTVVLLAVLVAFAWFNGRDFRDQRASEADLAARAATEHLENERAAVEAGEEGGFSGRAGSARTAAVAPPGRLADFTIGQSELYPYKAEISAFRRSDDLFRNYQLQSPLTLQAGRFDLAFVVIYLLPLLLIALTFNLLSAEKESGTLPLLLTQPVSLSQLVVAKLTVRGVSVLGVFALLVVIGFALSADFTNQRLPLMLLWTAGALAYGVFWLALIAWVAALGKRSESSAVILASLWLAIIVVLPATLNVLVSNVVPTPSRLEYVSAMRSATAQAAQESASLLANYYEDHPELAATEMQSGFLPAYFAQQRQIEGQVTPIVAEFEQRLDEQQRWVALGSLISPAILLQETLNTIAGTGLERQQRYVAQAREYLQRWHEALAPKVFTTADMQPADYDQLPQFSFDEPPLAQLAGRTAISVALLLGASVALLLLTRKRLASYPVAVN